MENEKYFQLIDDAYYDPSKTEEMIKDVIRKCGEDKGENSAIYASMVCELGGYYRCFKRFEESEKYYNESLNILERLVGQNHPDYATTLTNLAGTHRLMKKHELAESEYAKCLEIFKNTLGTDHVLYAAALNNLSISALDRGDFKKAAELLAQVCEVLKKNPDKTSEYATTLANLGSLYMNIGDFDKTEESLQKARQLYEDKIGTDSSHYYMILNSIGISRLKCQNYVEAKEYFEKAAANAQYIFGDKHPEYLSLLKHIEIAEEGIKANERS